MRILIFGQAKSGTTALMRSVSTALPDAIEVLEPEDLKAVDLTRTNLVVKKLFGPHNRNEGIVYSEFDHRLLLVRDPRDRFISALLYDAFGRTELPSEAFDPFLELLTAKEADPASVPLFELHHTYWKITGLDLFTNAARSTQRLRSFYRNSAGSFRLVRYEDFVSPESNQQLADELGVGSLEQPVITDDLARVSRTRGQGSWRRWLTPSDLRVFEPFADGVLDEFGYTHDWELDPHPVIQPAEASDYVRSLLASRSAEPTG